MNLSLATYLLTKLTNTLNLYICQKGKHSHTLYIVECNRDLELMGNDSKMARFSLSWKESINPCVYCFLLLQHLNCWKDINLNGNCVHHTPSSNLLCAPWPAERSSSSSQPLTPVLTTPRKHCATKVRNLFSELSIPKTIIKPLRNV